MELMIGRDTNLECADILFVFPPWIEPLRDAGYRLQGIGDARMRVRIQQALQMRQIALGPGRAILADGR
jgi:hypothetical protein